MSADGPSEPAPDGEALAPDGEALAPDGEPLAPDGEALAPEREPLAPEREPLAPEREPLAPDGEPLAHDVIIVAGGGGTRLGGLDKAALEVGGRALLDRVLEGTMGARQVVVVGDTPTPPGVLRAMEDPPGGGPVAGIAAGLVALSRSADQAPPTWTLVLAVDQPGAGAAVPALLAAAGGAAPAVDLVCPHDGEGHPQWLLAAYRTSSLQDALVPFGTGHAVSVRRLVAGLTTLDVPTADQGDIDTWEDHARWEEQLDGAAGRRAKGAP